MRFRARFLLAGAAAWLLAACSDAAAPPLEAPAAPAASRAGAPDVRDRWIVVFNNSVADPRSTAARVVEERGGTLHFVYEHALRGFAATLPATAAEALRRDPRVAYVEPDGVVHAADVQYGAPWGLDRIDQRYLALDGNYGYHVTGYGVNVYVADSGIRFSHAEFGGRAVPGTDVIMDGWNGSDCHGHGTSIAGVIGGATYGVAKQATLHSVRVLGCTGSGNTSAFVAGIDWIRQNHAKPAVVNASLVFTGISAAADEAVQSLLDAGVLLVAAAGNNNIDACSVSPGWKAAVLTVAATDASDVRYGASNWGACVDVFAPGVSIFSAGNGGDYATSTRSGTSLAAAHVTGAVARFLQSRPGAKPADAHVFVENNATANVVASPGYLTPNRLLWVDPAARRLTIGKIEVQGVSPGQAKHSVEVLDGMGSYRYSWYVNGALQTSGASDTFYFASDGTDYTVSVTVADAVETASTWTYVDGGGCGGGGSGETLWEQRQMQMTDAMVVC